MTLPNFCPHCKHNMRYKPVPEQDRQRFGGAEFFMHWIAHVWNDRTRDFTCPFCGHRLGEERKA